MSTELSLQPRAPALLNSDPSQPVSVSLPPPPRTNVRGGASLHTAIPLLPVPVPGALLSSLHGHF